MELAAIILSTISLIIGIICLSWLIGQRISSHKISYVPVDPFKDQMPAEIGKDIFNQFREIGDPIDQDELDRLNKKIISD